MVVHVAVGFEMVHLQNLKRDRSSKYQINLHTFI